MNKEDILEGMVTWARLHGVDLDSLRTFHPVSGSPLDFLAGCIADLVTARRLPRGVNAPRPKFGRLSR